VHFSYVAKNTPLRSLPELAKEFGVGEVLVKDESFNPYGTHKDRRSEYIVNIALEHGVDKIVCLTAGNAGYSLSRYCARVGIDYTSMVFPRVSEERKQILKER
jgi:threonine synthase